MSVINLNYINKKDRSLFMNTYNKQHFFEGRLSVKEYSDSIILPNTDNNGGVYDSGMFVYNTGLHRSWVKTFPDKITAKKKENKEVVYLGMLHNIWGHCITDNLKHLWFLNSPDFQYLKNLDFVYCTINDDFSFSQNFKDLLSVLGINTDNLIRITEPTLFSKVYIPDECFFYNPESKCYQYTKEYRQIIDTLCPVKDSIDTNLKLYFSRTALKTRKETGEKQIETIFSEHGYKIIHPEQMSFQEIICLLQKCSTFAATEGSISHNSVFCPTNCELIILRKYNGSFNSYQLALNSVKQQNTTFIDCSKSVFIDKKSPWSGPFFLYISHNLTSFFSVHNKIFPFTSFVTDYYLYWLIRRTKHLLLGK